MKITVVRAHSFSAPLEQALWTAQEALKDSSILLVEVQTDEGLTRFGEVIAGMDPLGHEIIWNRLFNLTVPRPRAMFGADGVFPPVPRSSRPQVMAAIGGIDLALWGLEGKAADMPV